MEELRSRQRNGRRENKLIIALMNENFIVNVFLDIEMCYRKSSRDFHHTHIVLDDGPQGGEEIAGGHMLLPQVLCFYDACLGNCLLIYNPGTLIAIHTETRTSFSCF